MQGRVRLTFFACVYFILKMAALVWYRVEDGEGLQLFHARSSASIIAMIVQCLAGIRFMQYTQMSMDKWPEHRRFFWILRLVGSLDIFAMPVGLVIVGAITDMYRAKVYFNWQCALGMACKFCLLILYHPRISKRTFPFHAQIEDMKEYKLRQIEMAGHLSNNINSGLDGNSGTSAGGGVGGGGSNKGRKPISFTGGPKPDDTTSIDSSGRVRPPSYFDKKQIGRLKLASHEVDNMIASLNEYSHTLSSVLDKVNTDDNSKHRKQLTRMQVCLSLSLTLKAFFSILLAPCLM